jgi:hypothetical protein
MIPYKVKFIIDEKANNTIQFESNEKPSKGEIFTIHESEGKLWDARITAVTKFIVRTKDKDAPATLEYHCQVQEHDSKTAVIGFTK